MQFRFLRENVDTTTASGKLTFDLFAALAEFGRDLPHERTTAAWKPSPPPGPAAALVAGPAR